MDFRPITFQGALLVFGLTDNVKVPALSSVNRPTDSVV